MSVVISTVKEDLSGIIHSTTIDKVTNINGVLSRVARTMLAKCRPPETIRIAQISNAVYDEIFDYDVASDLYGKKLIDIRPQTNRRESDSFSGRTARTFDKYKKTGTFHIRYNKGVKTLRLSEAISPPAKLLHDMNSLTDNGTWSVGGAATNLRTDELNFVSGNASLKFDTDGSGTEAYIENSDMDAIDLSDEENIARLFDRIYIPDISLITSWELRWGSSASDYWTRTVTSPFDQDTFKIGWNTLGNDWNGVTEVGSPDSSAVNYLRVTVNLSSAVVETDLRVDRISASSGRIYETEYYSESLFEDSSGARKNTVTSDDDVLILDEDGYNIFLRECQLDIAQQLQGRDATYDKNDANEHLYGNRAIRKVGLYSAYKKDNPDRSMKTRTYYYRLDTYNRPISTKSRSSKLR